MNKPYSYYYLKRSYYVLFNIAILSSLIYH